MGELQVPPGQVFVSYFAAESADIFSLLVSTLAARGYNVFEPTKGLVNPSKAEMRKHVRASSLVLVVMSNAYFTSEYCHAELEEAFESNVTVVPVFDGDSYTQNGLLKLKNPNMDNVFKLFPVLLRQFAFSKNIVRVKDTQDQKKASADLFEALQKHWPTWDDTSQFGYRC